MSIASALQKCKRKHGLSDVQVAAAVGTSESTVGRWCAGKGNPRLEHYQALIKLFPELPAMVGAGL